jgi:DHA1 family bicyclomycin/chloramphenicol resistance-like MFS transporter
MVSARVTPSPAAAPAAVADPARRRGARGSGSLIVALGALTTIAPLGTDMYIPGFPRMGVALHATDSAVQLSMTTFFVGIVLGQLFVGPLSDKIGRRRPMLVGTALFAVLSIVCAVAPNIEALDAARFLQGLAASAGMVLARAVVTDRFHGPELPRYFAMLAMVLGVAPVVAPLLGSLILGLAGWRTVFVVLAVIGALLTATVVVFVPESLPPERRSARGLGTTFGAMGTLLRHRAFVGYVLAGALATGAMFTYISGSSFVFERVYGTSASLYALVFATNAASMLTANSVFGRLSRRFSLNMLLTAAVSVAVAGALLQVLLLATVGGSMAGTWVSLVVIQSGIGAMFPASMSLGQAIGRRSAGAAAAVQGGSQFALGAVAAPLVGLFGAHSSAPMAVIQFVGLALALVALLGLARPWRREGELRHGPADIPSQQSATDLPAPQAG